MIATPYLAFNGNCEEAFAYYANALRGKVTALFRHEGTPAEASVPAEWKQKIMYARIDAGGAVLEGGDAPMGQYTKPSGFCVNLTFTADQIGEAERIYNELSQGAKIQMPLGETFWAKRFAMFIDRFNIPWMINCS